jgi:hypothetical protein
MVKTQTTSRTNKSKYAKQSKFPKWVIAVVLLLIAGTGLYMVYNSFAAGPTVRTIYCKQGTCWNVQMPGSIAKSAYTRTNYSCGGSLYLEYRVVGAKTSWNCLITGA